MDFTLSEEQEMLKNSARDFLRNECGKKLLRELEKSESGFSRKLWDGMADLSWMGILVPESHGGVGLSFLELGVLFEEFGRAALNGPMLGTAMGTLALLEGGSEGQEGALLAEVAAGKRIFAFALEEPGISYDPRFVSLRAEGTDGGYCLSGTKLFVPYAAVADTLFVVARTRGNPGDRDGVTLFRVAAGAAGLERTPLKTLAGDKQYQVEFRGVRVPAREVSGTPGGGLPLVLAILEKATAVQCAEMVGGAQYELEVTAEYCRTRVQFNRPIGSFQAVQHRLADMFVDVQGARLTTYQALWRLSEGLPAAREVAIAKAFTSGAARRVAFSAQQLHAGMGYDLDHELHFYYRRAKTLELKLGSVPAQLTALGGELRL